MMYMSVPHIFETIDETRERLYRRAEGLSPSQLNTRPNPDAWSVAEILEHVTLVEGRLLGMLKILLTKAEGASAKASSSPVEMQPFSLEQYLERARNEKYKAPETAHPSGKVSLADSLLKMRQAREELHGLVSRIEALDLSSAAYPHPAFGPLNFYQWLAFIGIHDERHLGQIEKVLAS